MLENHCRDPLLTNGGFSGTKEVLLKWTGIYSDFRAEEREATETWVLVFLLSRLYCNSLGKSQPL